MTLWLDAAKGWQQVKLSVFAKFIAVLNVIHHSDVNGLVETDGTALKYLRAFVRVF